MQGRLERGIRRAPFLRHHPAVAASIDAFDAMLDNVRGQIDDAAALADRKPAAFAAHRADSAAGAGVGPRHTAAGRLAEKVFDAGGVSEAGRVAGEHGKGLEDDIHEDPVADALVGELVDVAVMRGVFFKVTEGFNKRGHGGVVVS